MKTHFTIRVILTCVILFSALQFAAACSSFAVYSDNVYYGMNFDYPNRELRFTVNTSDDTISYFDMAFEDGNHYSGTVGMNEFGIFSSGQMVYPLNTNWPEPLPGLGEMNLGYAYWVNLNFFSSSDELLEYYTEDVSNVLGVNGLSVHLFSAGPSGTSFVLEPTDTGHVITQTLEDFQVMTNFPVMNFVDVPYTEVSGVGASRYIALYESIRDNFDTFDLEDAFNALDCCTQGGTYATRSSCVFDPVENDVYIVLQRDFEHIWRLDIDERYIETYQGFETYQSLPVGSGEEGVTSTQLRAMAINNEKMISSKASLDLRAYPNPFNPATTISFELEQDDEVALSIYNIKGQLVKTLVSNELFSSGSHTIAWDGKDNSGTGCTSGVYFIKMESGEAVRTEKILMMK